MRGDAIEGIKFSLVCVETPGHATNHRAFALPRESALFSSDHVMAWPTAAAAAPDGALRPFMAALAGRILVFGFCLPGGFTNPEQTPHEAKNGAPMSSVTTQETLYVTSFGPRQGNAG
jgi:glyoxylase-like metal-dependent hydrolase (beta-lactamase superfamily II)